MNPRITPFVREYLQADTLTMQLATVSDAKPWIATVYFVADDDLNIYWLSWPERRHSKESVINPHVAAAIVVKADQPVIGLQIEGEVSELTDKNAITKIMDRYIDKYDTGEKFAENVARGTNRHVLYKLTPHTIQLFDELNFPDRSPFQIEL